MPAARCALPVVCSIKLTRENFSNFKEPVSWHVRTSLTVMFGRWVFYTWFLTRTIRLRQVIHCFWRLIQWRQSLSRIRHVKARNQKKADTNNNERLKTTAWNPTLLFADVFSLIFISIILDSLQSSDPQRGSEYFLRLTIKNPGFFFDYLAWYLLYVDCRLLVASQTSIVLGSNRGSILFLTGRQFLRMVIVDSFIAPARYNKY